jgi:hypothetical protein
VPQNWTGTYGGDPATYGEDLKRQILVGEYGAWRTLDLHSTVSSFQSNVYSEERMTRLMEMKIRLAETVKDSSAGHFMWLLTSHDNPGRVQSGEGFREVDRIGPVNYKGLLTPWEEPLDVYYMYRSNYAPKNKAPMVYIVSHTWPNRWTTGGKKNGIIVYSNCDEVELFNDVHSISLGKKKKQGAGTHFQWDDVDIRYNVLYAVGYVNDKEVAKDCLLLNHLPAAPHFNEFFKDARRMTAPQPGYNYLYRINCGGGDYEDENGNLWLADRAFDNPAPDYRGPIGNTRVEHNGTSSPLTTHSSQHWGSTSWTNDFAGMSPFFASQRRIFDPITGTKDWKLFQTFRFGREKLKYSFPVQDGEYLIEFYFIEPWLRKGEGMDCTGMRLFDVAVNDKIVLKSVDIWKEAGHNAALKKMIKTKITGRQLVISFPHVAAGQAVISAIAIASLDKKLKPALPPPSIFKVLSSSDNSTGNRWSIQYWFDEGDEQWAHANTRFTSVPPELFGAEWIKTLQTISSAAEFPTIEVTRDADLFIAIDSSVNQPDWLKGFVNTKSVVQNDANKAYTVYENRFRKGEQIKLNHEGVINNEMYLVIALPATSMEPAYDLKPVASYKAINVKLQGPGIVKGQVDGKDRVIFQSASAENLLEWNFAIGVADKYSLTISYNNPRMEIIKGHIELLAADETVLKEEEIQFTPTKEGKSNYIVTSTGSMINAGGYKLRLRSKEAAGLSINSLDIQ